MLEVAIDLNQIKNGIEALAWTIPILACTKGHINLKAINRYLESKKLDPDLVDTTPFTEKVFYAHDHQIEAKGPTPNSDQYVIRIGKLFNLDRFVIDRKELLPTGKFLDEGDEVIAGFPHKHDGGSSIDGYEV